jgi:predicted short-subunit dehydrogenase-like oxidoreductase (DUF2520 family)
MSDLSPNVFVVGAGPVATMLAGALRKSGVPVLGLWARRPDAARQAGAVAGVAAFSSAPPDLLLNADTIIVAVRDSAITEVATMLVGTGLVNRRHVLIHCAGSISAESAFASVQGKVAGAGVVHPLRAISDPRRAMEDLNGAVFGVEGDDPGKRCASTLVAAMGGRALPLQGQQMAAYHTAAAMASNLVVALLDSAVAVLQQAGVSGDDALAALVPLTVGAMQNVARTGLAAGLTGAVKRGDAATVQQHLSVLAAHPDRSVADVYRSLSLRALLLAHDGLSQSDEQTLRTILTT